MLHIYKTIFVYLVALLLPAIAISQDDAPKTPNRSVEFDFTTTQTAYSDSWVGGEAGSVNWVANLNAHKTRPFGEKFELRSSLKLSFGQTLTQDATTKDWSKPKKSTDLIDWENVGSIKVGGSVNPYVAFRLESQFYDGRNPNKKLFLSPMKLTESAGITRTFYETEKDFLVSRLGLGVRQIITKFISNPTTLESASTTTSDAGIESVTEIEQALHNNIRYNGKLSLFKALSYSESDKVKGTPTEDAWKAVDVNFENRFSAAVSKIVTVNLYLQFLYDKEISRKTRIKETVALGFVFRMI